MTKRRSRTASACWLNESNHGKRDIISQQIVSASACAKLLSHRPTCQISTVLQLDAPASQSLLGRRDCSKIVRARPPTYDMRLATY
eukprot:6183257-Pleurochrysis_carterae.AAC.1